VEQLSEELDFGGWGELATTSGLSVITAAGTEPIQVREFLANGVPQLVDFRQACARGSDLGVQVPLHQAILQPASV
jgi:hypothetical protein